MALTMRRKHIVNFYEYSLDKNLNIKNFSEMTDEWVYLIGLANVFHCDYEIINRKVFVKGSFYVHKKGITIQYFSYL